MRRFPFLSLAVLTAATTSAAAPALPGGAPRGNPPATAVGRVADLHGTAPASRPLACTLTVSGEGPHARSRRVPAPGPVVLSASRIEDLGLDAALQNPATGDHVVEFRLLMPGGRLYQSVSVPVSLRGAGQRWGASELRAAPSHREVAGYPFPLAVQRPEVSSGHTGRRAAEGAPEALRGVPTAHVTAAVPVAGTPIVNSSLYGSWTVAVYVDGAETACAEAVARIQQ